MYPRLWCVFFFFSSRRRHTRCSRDWSSDVCSSDLLEGRLEPRSGSTDTVPRDLVEARLLLGVQPVPWLTLGVGPHVRAFVFDTTTVRWVMWQARARVQGALPSPRLETDVELWYALSAKVNP